MSTMVFMMIVSMLMLSLLFSTVIKFEVFLNLFLIFYVNYLFQFEASFLCLINFILDTLDNPLINSNHFKLLNWYEVFLILIKIYVFQSF